MSPGRKICTLEPRGTGVPAGAKSPPFRPTNVPPNCSTKGKPRRVVAVGRVEDVVVGLGEFADAHRHARDQPGVEIIPGAGLAVARHPDEPPARVIGIVEQVVAQVLARHHVREDVGEDSQSLML